MRLPLIPAACVLLSASLAARADDIVNYQLSGTESSFANGPTESVTYPTVMVSGTMSVDLTTQTILTFNLDGSGYGGGPLDDSSNFCEVYNPLTYFCSAVSTSAFYINNSYGHISFPDGDEGRVTEIFQGSAMPASVTPEPSSIALFGTGLLGMAGVVRKRFA